MTIDGQALTFTGGNSSFQQFTWPGATCQGVKLTVKMSGGSDLIGRLTAERGECSISLPTRSKHTRMETSTPWSGSCATGGRPMTTPDGKPVTVQFDLDTLGQAPLLRKGFLSEMHCVPSVAR